MALVFLRNADPLITNGAHGISPVPLHPETHRGSRLRIFHGVAQEIGKNVREQSFVCQSFRRHWTQQQFNVASAIGRRENFIEHAATKCV
jgi:hypothetical protein